MDERLFLGVLAITLGVVVGVLLFVPFVALSYRRRGGFRTGRFVLWGVALASFVAIWIYTLLPLPDPDTIVCAGANLDPGTFADDLRTAIARRGGDAATDPALLQPLLNVLLFVPLGFLLRVLWGRGVITALVVGALLSGFVELSQLTGVWGLYPCAYRVFDVDDILMNTLGVVLGSLLALAVPRRHWGSPPPTGADAPRPVTRARRLFGMVCDVVAAGLLSLSAAVVMQLVLYRLGAGGAVREGSAAALVGEAVAIVVWLVVTLATGSTIGDHTAQLRFSGGELPVPLARFLRFIGGIGGYLVLTALPGAWAYVAWVFATVSIALVFMTDRGRGLPGVVSGQRLGDVRELGESDAAPPGSTRAQ